MRPVVVFACFFSLLGGLTVFANERSNVVTEVIGSFGGYQTIPVALNNAGQVVGVVVTGRGWGYSVFQWSRQEGFRIIADDAYVTGINDRGDVVGSLVKCVQAPDGSSSCGGPGFLWNAATGFRTLGDFQPTAVNNRGDMSGDCVSQSLEHVVPCAMHDGVVTKWECEIAKEPCGGGTGGINARGDVVGHFGYYDYDPEPIVWRRKGGELRLGTGGYPTDINNAGAVTGWSYGIATVWLKGGEQRHVLAPSYAMGIAINAAGVVAGITGEYPGKAFRWDSKRGSLTFLAPEAFVSEVMDINNRGQILGLLDSQPVIWQVIGTR